METKTTQKTETEAQAAQVNISPLAATKLKEMMGKMKAEELAGKGLRIFVKSGGCKGFSYGMGFDKPRDGDISSSIEGIQVYIDPQSAPYLQGAAVDFKDAMMGGGFTISNPNATSNCGCGQSFKAKGERGNPQSCGSESAQEHSHGAAPSGGGCGSGGSSGGCC